MGQTAENVAEYEHVTREDMDEFAPKRSQDNAVANVENGFFAEEITPIVPDGTVVTKDGGPRPGTTLEGLAQLRPVFRPDGSTVTAGNACPLNDGAAAVVVMSDTKAAELGIRPLARSSRPGFRR